MDVEREVREEPSLLRLAVDLWVKWRRLLCYKRMRGAGDTNNATDEWICKSKVIYKTLLGYKSIEGMMNGLG